MANLLVSAAVNIVAGLVLSYLFPTVIEQEGPRLSDLSVTTSTYGKVINKLYGTARMSGNIIWCPGIIEEKNTETVGGKGIGGPTTKITTYEYFVSMQIAFCEGPVQRCLRIWGDSKLIYDRTGGNELSDSKIPEFRFYGGTETQMPDPIIEAEQDEEVSANRGLCHLVFERLPLADFANHIPNITAELSANATDSMPFTELQLLPGVNFPGSNTGADTNSFIFIAPFTDELYFFKTGSSGLSRSSVVTMAMEVSTNYPSGEGPIFDYTMAPGMDGLIYGQLDGANYVGISEIDPVGLNTIRQYGENHPLGGPFPNGVFIGVLRKGFPEFGVAAKEYLIVSFASIFQDGGVKVYEKVLTPEGEHTIVEISYLELNDLGRGGPVIMDWHNARAFVLQEDDDTVYVQEILIEFSLSEYGPGTSLVQVVERAQIEKNGVHLTGSGDIEGWCVAVQEQALILSNGVSMCRVDMNGSGVETVNLDLGFYTKHQWTTNSLFAFGNGEAGNTAQGVIYVVSVNSLQINETQDLDAAEFPDGFTSNQPRGAYDPRNHSYIFSRFHGNGGIADNFVVRVLLQRSNGVGVPLSDIVVDQCERAGLENEDYDVSDLTEDSVWGFVCSKQSTVRENLEPLMKAYLFEGTESDFKMVFRKRGGDPVMELDPNYVGLDTDIPINETIIQEAELPERVYTKYADHETDYQQGTQHAKRQRLPTPTMYARNEVTLDLPLVSDATTMKQLAERVLYTSWAERTGLNSGLPVRYIRLDPTDVVVMPYKGDDLRLRLLDVEIGNDFSINFKSTQEDASTDISVLIGSPGSGFIPQIIPSKLPSRVLLMDLPLLQDADDLFQQASRAYWATAGWDSSWPGMVLYQSRDNGVVYTEIGQQGFEAAWGTVDGILPDAGNVVTWDETSTIRLKVRRGVGRFMSSTDLEVLNGANRLAILSPNGPEIIQFVNVTQINDHTVELSRLLRGRRGTEPLAYNHTAYETFVLLENARFESYAMPLNLLDVVLPYKGVTLNTHLEATPTVYFAHTGQDLVPYSVCHIEGDRTTGDLVVEWTRRTRYLGELVDGLGEVPLNETIEEYDIEWYYMGEMIAEETVTAETATLTAATWGSLGFSDGHGPLVDGDFNNAAESAWEPVSPMISIESVTYDTYANVDGTLAPHTVGNDFIAFGAQVGQDDSEIRQDIDLLAHDYAGDVLDAELPLVTVDYWHAGLRNLQAEPTEVRIAFFDEDGVYMPPAITTGLIVPPDFTWTAGSVSANLPLGARSLRIRLIGYRTGFGGDSPEVAFADVSLTIGTGIPPLRVKVFQKSAIVGRGREVETVV